MQCVTVPKMLDDTDTNTFSGTKYFRYRFRDFSGTKFFWYRFRYHQKKWKIPGSRYLYSKYEKVATDHLCTSKLLEYVIPPPAAAPARKKIIRVDSVLTLV